MADRGTLKLMAEDAVDLQIISAAIQDAVGKAGGLKFLARKRRFTIETNRFRWEDVDPNQKTQTRVRTILGIDGVLGVRSRGLTKSDPELVVSLLSLTFEPGEAAPAGQIRLTFAGDGELVLDVECLDVTLLDSDTQWSTKHTPDHDRKDRP
jgi:hypothetical protein